VDPKKIIRPNNLLKIIKNLKKEGAQGCSKNQKFAQKAPISFKVPQNWVLHLF
jgi:hypothetical protein